jgi:hypothetical protein
MVYTDIIIELRFKSEIVKSPLSTAFKFFLYSSIFSVSPRMPVLDTLKNFIRQGKNAVSAHQGGASLKERFDHDDEKQSFNHAEAAVRIVEEEKLAKADKRLPSYPNLQRYTLISEMGE